MPCWVESLLSSIMTNVDPEKTDRGREPSPSVRIAALVAVAVSLVVWGTPPVALVAGIAFAMTLGNPLARHSQKISKTLLQVCVVLLGVGMDLPVVLRLGLNGSVFAAVTIGCTLALGLWLGGRLRVDRRTSVLISSGTAICGGSAIAAVSSVIAATEAEIAVSIGTVFLLNAAALYLFPVVGHALHLSQAQFGLWAGVAIHDISSVVGAGMSYGADALNAATAVKLSRTLWIAPLTLAIAVAFRKGLIATGTNGGVPTTRKAKIAVPWFIGLFLLASLARSYVPGVTAWSPDASALAKRGMVLVLFLIGTSVSLGGLRVVGWRVVVVGLLLWAFISIASLAAIVGLGLTA
jgi:uncharacterized integral membrane protein (TIGR00698 family)